MRGAAARYVIVDHRRMVGVTLSKRGHWGNIPYDDAASAERAARADAGGQAIEIERVTR